jgi:hypothetical protein
MISTADSGWGATDMSIYDTAVVGLRAQRTELEADLELWAQRASPFGDLPLHQSQVSRLRRQLTSALGAALEGTPLEGDKTPPFDGSLAQLPELRRAVGTVHLLWDFFRDKLAQRDTPAYRQHLGVADDFAWLCYEPFLRAASTADVPNKLECKEPPLVFCVADRAPFAQARTKALHPPGLDSKDLEKVTEEVRRLPVPVIGMPWAVVNRLPPMVLIGHETGHVIAEDLGLAAEARAVIASLNLDGRDAEKRKGVWKSWSDETFADIIGVLATGTAFVSGLAAEMAASPSEIEQARINDSKPGRYPTPTLRIALCEEILRLLGIDPPKAWSSTYPRIAGDSGAYARDITPLAEALFRHEWTSVGAQQLSKLLPWNPGLEQDAAKVAGTTLRKIPASVNFSVRVWIAAAMHASLANPQEFKNQALDKQMASFIIARRSDAVRFVPHPLERSTSDAPGNRLRMIDDEAGRGIAERLNLHP